MWDLSGENPWSVLQRWTSGRGVREGGERVVNWMSVKEFLCEEFGGTRTVLAHPKVSRYDGSQVIVILSNSGGKLTWGN